MGPKPLRIFIPANKGSKFDPEADHNRHRLPELHHASTRDLISGEIAPLKSRDFLTPIVIHKQQLRFKAIYSSLPRGSG
jgi:deoxyribodipyrimidine photolyase